LSSFAGVGGVLILRVEDIDHIVNLHLGEVALPLYLDDLLFKLVYFLFIFFVFVVYFEILLSQVLLDDLQLALVLLQLKVDLFGLL